MDKTEFLSRYHNLEIKIQKKKEYIDFCDERSLSIPGPSYGEKIGTNPNRNTDAPFVKWIYKKIDAEAELKELEEKASKTKMEIEEMIANLKNDDFERILTYRYIDWLTWDEIGERMYLSRSTVKRWHKEALELIKISIFIV